MNWIKKECKSFLFSLKKNEWGFTMMETLVSLFLFSLFQLWFWQGTTHSQLSMLKIAHIQSNQNALMQAKFYSNEFLSNIEIPFFLKEVPVTILPDSLIIRYPSKEEELMIFSVDPHLHQLFITTPTRSMVINNIYAMQSTPIYNKKNNMYALQIRFFDADGHFVDLYYHFLGLLHDKS